MYVCIHIYVYKFPSEIWWRDPTCLSVVKTEALKHTHAQRVRVLRLPVSLSQK